MRSTTCPGSPERESSCPSRGYRTNRVSTPFFRRIRWYSSAVQTGVRVSFSLWIRRVGVSTSSAWPVGDRSQSHPGSSEGTVSKPPPGGTGASAPATAASAPTT